MFLCKCKLKKFLLPYLNWLFSSCDWFANTDPGGLSFVFLLCHSNKLHVHTSFLQYFLDFGVVPQHIGVMPSSNNPFLTTTLGFGASQSTPNIEHQTQVRKITLTRFLSRQHPFNQRQKCIFAFQFQGSPFAGINSRHFLQ